jgi:hypothetical protein
MPLMSHGFVTSATLQNGKITFSVGVYEFKAGEPVEISGYATQTNGAFVNIYQIKQVPDMADPAVDVTVDPQSGQQFSQDDEITVVIRAAKVWVTVLGSTQPVGVGPESVPPGGPITWGNVQVVTRLNGDTGSPGQWAAQAVFAPQAV